MLTSIFSRVFYWIQSLFPKQRRRKPLKRRPSKQNIPQQKLKLVQTRLYEDSKTYDIARARVNHQREIHGHGKSEFFYWQQALASTWYPPALGSSVTEVAQVSTAPSPALLTSAPDLKQDEVVKRQRDKMEKILNEIRAGHRSKDDYYLAYLQTRWPGHSREWYLAKMQESDKQKQPEKVAIGASKPSASQYSTRSFEQTEDAAIEAKRQEVYRATLSWAKAEALYRKAKRESPRITEYRAWEKALEIHLWENRWDRWKDHKIRQ